MYAKKHRLSIGHNRFRAAAVERSKSFWVKSAPSPAAHNRFAIIVSKSAAKRATQRNFWKRVIADDLRRWPNIKKDILVIVSPKLNNVAPEEVREELQAVLRKMRGEATRQSMLQARVVKPKTQNSP